MGNIMKKVVRNKIVPKRMFYDISNHKNKRTCLFYICILVYLFFCGTVNSLSCYQCIGTHPGCTLYNMDWIYQKIITCPRIDDRCVKLIERKGSDVMVTRDCLSNLEAHRVDIPADKYEGCRPATKEVKLGQYTFNRIKELDTKRNHYDNTTWCFCQFDHWCNGSQKANFSILMLFFGSLLQRIFA